MGSGVLAFPSHLEDRSRRERVRTGAEGTHPVDRGLCEALGSSCIALTGRELVAETAPTWTPSEGAKPNFKGPESKTIPARKAAACGRCHCTTPEGRSSPSKEPRRPIEKGFLGG